MIGISTLFTPLGALIGGFLGKIITTDIIISIAAFIIFIISCFWSINKRFLNDISFSKIFDF